MPFVTDGDRDMNAKILLFAIFALAGCQSLNDTRSNGKELTFISRSSVDEVSQCILVKWQNEKDIFGVPYGAFIQPLPDGKTVYVNGNYFIADVTSSGINKTTVKLYQLASKDRWIKITNSCL
ncbi:hypothetical protein [Rahnella aceris]